MDTAATKRRVLRLRRADALALVLALLFAAGAIGVGQVINI